MNLQELEQVPLVNLKKFIRINKDLTIDWEQPNQVWLARFYYFAKLNKLKDYQARSFASEMALFYCNEIISTEVEMIYREDRLDAYFKDLHNTIFLNGEDWNSFMQKMLEFYESRKSWEYEKSNRHMIVRVTEYENTLIESLGCPDFHRVVNQFIKNYDYNCKERLYPVRESGKLISKAAFLTESEYGLFMSIPYRSKTDKFLQLLYYYFFREETE